MRKKYKTMSYPQNIFAEITAIDLNEDIYKKAFEILENEEQECLLCRYKDKLEYIQIAKRHNLDTTEVRKNIITALKKIWRYAEKEECEKNIKEGVIKKTNTRYCYICGEIPDGVYWRLRDNDIIDLSQIKTTSQLLKLSGVGKANAKKIYEICDKLGVSVFDDAKDDKHEYETLSWLKYKWNDNLAEAPQGEKILILTANKNIVKVAIYQDISNTDFLAWAYETEVIENLEQKKKIYKKIRAIKRDNRNWRSLKEIPLNQKVYLLRNDGTVIKKKVTSRTGIIDQEVLRQIYGFKAFAYIGD